MSDLQDAAIQFAETIQTAHINKHPSTQDIAPPTAADSKQRVQIDDTVDLDDVSEVGEGEIPVSLLRPTPRKPVMPPLPDLRFEQSYLASIKDAKGWQGVTFITLRDQVCHGRKMGEHHREDWSLTMKPSARDASSARHGVDPHRFWLAALEREHHLHR